MEFSFNLNYDSKDGLNYFYTSDNNFSTTFNSLDESIFNFVRDMSTEIRPQTPASNEFINQLPIIKEPINNIIECPICLDKLNFISSEEDIIYINLKKCNHSFHKDCLKEWTKDNNTCPICRCIFPNHPNDVGLLTVKQERILDEALKEI